MHMGNTKKKKESNKKSKTHNKGGQSSVKQDEYMVEPEVTEIDVIEIDNLDELSSKTK